MTDEQRIKENMVKLGETIRDIPVAMLTTQQKDGSLHSRPMLTQDAPFDGTLWFFTRPDTEKAETLKDHPQVNLGYSDPNNDRYISVTGRAEIVDDRDRAYDLWSPRFRAWFPKGLDDPELRLIKVKVESAEYWEASSVVRMAGFIDAVTRGKPYTGGENEKLNLRH